MRLKSFDIQGFKTFPDKLSLNVSGGLTAIVGPNGSGKSNIVEALRWVLGEQNAHALRCERKMEEIIFHGADNRGPVGFCEVSIRLDNSDNRFSAEGDELSITRRLYRSGESEYFINKQNVRLKDITMLLADTGLGRDGYSIIGQGMLKKIIDDRPGDRRKVFEEASGIAKFRTRKEESERKLKLASENLLRVSDKIDEIEPQMNTLRNQAETARKFLLLRDELRGHEINVWMENLSNIRRNYTSLKDSYRDLKASSEAASRESDELYKKSEEMDKTVAELRISEEASLEEVNRSEELLRETEGKIALLNSDSEHIDENIERLKAEFYKSESKAGTLTEQAEESLGRKRDLEEALRKNGEDMRRAIEEGYAVSEKTGAVISKLDVLRTGENENASRDASLRVEMSGAAAKLEALRASRQINEGKLQTRGEAGKEIANQLEILNKRLEEANEQNEALKNTVEGYNMRVSSRKRKFEEFTSEKSKLELELNGIKTRYQLLSAQEQEYQGFYGSVKLIMHERPGDVRGVLAELIKVSGVHATAIEVALGSALQNIVVGSEEDAKACVSLLKQRQAGRATFLPVSSVRGRVIDDPGNAPGFVGIASELVQTEDTYKNIVRSLLGRTVIVENLDQGISLARKNNYSFRIVTLDGQVLNAGGSITGGSVNKQTGLLTRKNEIDDLEKRIYKLEEKLEASISNLNEAEREMKAANYDLEIAQSESRELRETILSLSSEREHKLLLLKSGETEEETLKNELASVEKELEETENHQVELMEALANIREEGQTLKAEIEKLLSTHEGLSSEHEALQRRISDFRAEEALFRERILSEDRAYSELIRLKNELSGDKADSEAAIMELEKKKEGVFLQITALKEILAQHEADKESKKSNLSKIRARQMELEAERSVLLREIKDKNSLSASLLSECSKMENKLLTSESEEKAIVDRLWEQYDLTPSTAEKLRTEMESLSKATKRISELKKEMSSLGTPNLGAIDAFAEIGARYELLSSQRDDAEKAKTELLNIIEGITTEMKTIFEEHFSKINQRFGETFTEIFGGGSAYLELADAEDILNCGIDIKASPPGKKLRTISLLSGGEISLTAIALYFAIFKVRPAPFCLLDELDHELDDANVERYANYLSNLSKEAQFLVITHRRGTMERASMLFGVTAQESGVSKVIPLNISEVEFAG